MAENEKKAAPASGEDFSDEVMDDFGKRVVKEISFVRKELRQRNPEAADEFFQDLLKLPQKEFVETLFDTSDQIKIDTLKKSDAKFNRTNTFLRSVGNTAFLGAPEKIAALLEAPFSDQTVSEIIRDESERSRLMAKAYPGANVTGVIASFLGPTPAGKLFTAGAKSGVAATSKLAAKFVEKMGSNPAYAKRIGALIDNTLTRGAAAGAGGTAAYKVGSGLTKGIEDTVAELDTGEMKAGDLPGAFGNFVTSLKDETLNGAAMGAAFAAGGMAAAATYRGGKAALRAGLKAVGGKDLRYQLEHLEQMREVMETTPELVFAESAEAIAPKVQEMQGKFRAIETQAKNDLLRMVGDKKIALSKDFQKTADELSTAVSELRQAGEEGVARAATKLQDTVGKQYAARNRAYGQALEEITGNVTANVPLQKPLETIEQILRSNRALDGKGQLLPGSDWARQQPEAFQSLGDLWKRLGGEVKAAGGGPGITKNIQDAIALQRQLGELAGFGRKPSPFEKFHRDVYFAIKNETEAVAPKLKELNKAYSADRATLDDFRTAVGKNEQTIANKLRANLEDNRRIFVREAIESFAGLSDDAAAAVQEGTEISRRLNIVNGFKKNPKQVFGQLTQAYVKNDTLTLSALERIAEANPKLRPFLETAKRQASLMAELPKPGQVSRAAADPEAARLVQEAIPGSAEPIARAQAARQKAGELQRVLPEGRLQLEQAVGSQNFAAGELEKKVLAEATKQAPELAKPLERAEAARVADRIKTGKGAEKNLLEEIPFFGDTLFALRKRATPVASRLINAIGKAKPATRNAVIRDLWDDLEGSANVSRAALNSMIKRMEPEDALVMYAQNGGADDIIRSAEKNGIALSGDDEPESKKAK